jgi:hypothetical protein
MRVLSVVAGLLLGIWLFDNYANHGRYTDSFVRMAYEIKRSFLGR